MKVCFLLRLIPPLVVVSVEFVLVVGVVVVELVEEVDVFEFEFSFVVVLEEWESDEPPIGVVVEEVVPSVVEEPPAVLPDVVEVLPPVVLPVVEEPPLVVLPELVEELPPVVPPVAVEPPVVLPPVVVEVLPPVVLPVVPVVVLGVSLGSVVELPLGEVLPLWPVVELLPV
jgi:hypothetical protein